MFVSQSPALLNVGDQIVDSERPLRLITVESVDTESCKHKTHINGRFCYDNAVAVTIKTDSPEKSVEKTIEEMRKRSLRDLQQAFIEDDEAELKRQRRLERLDNDGQFYGEYATIY